MDEQHLVLKLSSSRLHVHIEACPVRSNSINVRTFVGTKMPEVYQRNTVMQRDESIVCLPAVDPSCDHPFFSLCCHGATQLVSLHNDTETAVRNI